MRNNLVDGWVSPLSLFRFDGCYEFLVFQLFGCLCECVCDCVCVRVMVFLLWSFLMPRGLECPSYLISFFVLKVLRVCYSGSLKCRGMEIILIYDVNFCHCGLDLLLMLFFFSSKDALFLFSEIIVKFWSADELICTNSNNIGKYVSMMYKKYHITI